jgi:LacI family transcriptional regulator
MYTIYDVAKEARVSIATVSNVINEKRKQVSQKTIEKVLQVMDKLGYVPSTIAMNLAKGKTRVIGVVVSDITNPFFAELVREVEKHLYDPGFDLFLADTRYSYEKSKEHIRKLMSAHVNGVLLLNNEVDDRIAAQLSAHGIPTVLYGWGMVLDHVCNLNVDFRYGIKEAIRHLYALNHRKVVFSRSRSSLKTFRDREEAFVSSVDEMNLNDFSYRIIEGESTMTGGQHIVSDVLKMKSFRASAIMSVNDIQAVGMLFSLYRHNVRVPEGMSLIGLDNIHFSSVVLPKLTTIDLSASRVADKVISMLFELIESGVKQGFEREIRTEFVLRDSTAVRN